MTRPYYSSAHHRGQQAMPNYTRVYTCEICKDVCVQLGPGRSRRLCIKASCQRANKNLRRKAWVSDFCLRGLALLLIVITGCAHVPADHWKACCIDHTICISDGKGGPNCDDMAQWCKYHPEMVECRASK